MQEFNLSLRKLVDVYVFLERMAKLMQKTRNPLEIGRDTIMSIGAALHLGIEPPHQNLNPVQKERKEFYATVIKVRGGIPRGNMYAPVPQREKELMFAFYKYIDKHAQVGFPGIQKINSILYASGWKHEDLHEYKICEPGMAMNRGLRFRA